MVYMTPVVVASPFTLAKHSCMFGIRSIFILIQTWIEMLYAAIYFQLNAFWRIIIWATAVLSLPVRALTALQREKMVFRLVLGRNSAIKCVKFEMRIHEMQLELENLIWAKKILDEQLKSAVSERRMVEALLVELEDEHDESICKMELLEYELHHLRFENQKLKEVQGKSFWSSKILGEGNRDNVQHAKDAGKLRAPFPKSKYTEDGSTGEKMIHAHTSEDEKISRSRTKDINKTSSKAQGPFQAYPHDRDSWHTGMNTVTLQKRDIALSQTLFSAVLALLVGAIVWAAKAPCTPLIVALFAVAVISLRTVLMFLSTIRNKPAMDAVALLSFNWFMLGLLSYPTLPMVAHFLSLVL